MAKIVSLAKVKKAATRKADRMEANANAAKFGRSKAARKLDEAAAEKAARDLEAHRREPD
ncbi:MAG: hypothetical protein B7Z10_05855 [Rhodobacterales bacterium 32-66-7]|nr:MAG: hypothetical protein B7Z10_05855 [Rhodobacterales bacterium 32-66-7]